MNHWKDIIGNQKLKSYLQGLISYSRIPSGLRGRHTLIGGLSRTAKTSTILFGIKAMFCTSTDKASNEPCNSCKVCHTLDKNGVVDRGLLACSEVLDRGLLYVPFDGNSVTRENLHQEILEASQESQYHHLFYIDEIQGLVRRSLDHELLIPIDKISNITWIVSTATTKGLDRMFINRFHEVRTELPTVPELAKFLCDLCERSDFNLKWDDEDTLFLLAKRSHQIVGLAIKCLMSAQHLRILTRKYVEDYPFGPLLEDEP